MVAAAEGVGDYVEKTGGALGDIAYGEIHGDNDAKIRGAEQLVESLETISIQNQVKVVKEVAKDVKDTAVGIKTEAENVVDAVGRGDFEAAGRSTADLGGNIIETGLTVLPVAKGVQALKTARVAKVAKATEATAKTSRASKVAKVEKAAGTAKAAKATRTADAAKAKPKAKTQTREAGGDGTKSVGEVLQGAGLDAKPVPSKRPVIPQETPNTCVAASCRMIAQDAGVAVSEQRLASALGTTDKGASVLDAGKVLDDLGVSGGVAESSTTLQALEEGLASGRSAVVGVDVPGIGRHALVLDDISAGRALIRDPLPVGVGSSFSISIKDFQFIFSGRAVKF